MHPKQKAFMRSEAMECEVAATQAASSVDGTIEDASEPNEAAATVATVPRERVEAGASRATLPETFAKQSLESGATKLKCKSGRSGKNRLEDCGRQTEDDTDDEVQWCSKGIAVLLPQEEEEKEKGNKKADDAESMDVDPAGRSEDRSSAAPARDTRSRSMMACFKPKARTSEGLWRVDTNGAHEVSHHPEPPDAPAVPRLGCSASLLPVTLASKLEWKPSIPHTFVPSTDVDMDTGESTKFTKVKPRIKEEQLDADDCTIKTEAGRDSHENQRFRESSVAGGLHGSSLYAPNPFTMVRSLPIMVKTEPGVVGPCTSMQQCSSPLAGQTFVSRSSSHAGMMVELMSKAASLPPMEALHRMQLEDLMRMNFVPLPPIKQEPPCHGVLPFQPLPSTASRLPPFYRKPDLISSVTGANAAKMFTCQQCGATFKHRHHVVRHMRAHTGEKPFRCEECGAMFARKCILTNHIRTHTGEKPYVCGECGDAFSRKHHLVIHRRTHTGEKPYICNVCATAFARSHHLNRHLKTHFLMQGHLPPPGEDGGAIDLSLHKMPDNQSGVIDLNAQKGAITNVTAISQVFNIGTDFAMGISSRSCSTTET
ncbi:uncharacterized protein [Diadema antillarum]|uniref:uncharacterized protein n=1 Tax=Diadema antillarum TaxID=105358 RepID=UPI003A8C1DC6